jgi:DNA repair exonuclease SbcCD ATPase subunit
MPTGPRRKTPRTGVAPGYTGGPQQGAPGDTYIGNSSSKNGERLAEAFDVRLRAALNRMLAFSTDKIPGKPSLQDYELAELALKLDSVENEIRAVAKDAYELNQNTRREAQEWRALEAEVGRRQQETERHEQDLRERERAVAEPERLVREAQQLADCLRQDLESLADDVESALPGGTLAQVFGKGRMRALRAAASRARSAAHQD